MLLDPMSALSLAGTVVQFVDFASKILTKGREIYSSASGSLAANDELGIVTNDLLRLTEQLKASAHQENEVRTLSMDEQALEAIASNCSSIGQELLRVLDLLKVQGQRGKWKTFYQAFKAVLKQGEIDSIMTRLSSFREELELHLLLSIKSQIDFKWLQQSDRFDSLDRSAQYIIHHMAENQSSIASKMDDQMKHLTTLQQHSELRIVEEHEMTRAEIRAALQLLGGAVNSSKETSRKTEDGLIATSWMKAKAGEQREMKEIRDSLWFPTIGDRFEDIAKAHRNSFSWVFRDPDLSTRPWDSFDEWLKRGKGVYWVTGKPGSGKSTLMKYLFSSPQTRKILEEYSKNQDIVFASFFFWNSGVRAQMTHDSLLRSLLFRILKQCPELIPIVLREQITEVNYKLLKSGGLHWTLPQLKRAFDRLTSKKDLRVKFFFAVDGLDEYDGDQTELAIWIRNIASPSFKIVASSRPWNVFMDTFRGLPRLRVQDLTFKDISAYVEDRLSNNERMHLLMEKDHYNGMALAFEIVNKSSGVFLWVTVAVTSLLDGLRNHDRISDLQARLRKLPDDLVDLYEVILRRTDSMYEKHRSRYFLMIQAVRSICEEAPMSLAFSLADEEDTQLCMTSKIQLMTRGEALDRCEEVERRLAAACAGLLEIDYRQVAELSDYERRRPLCNHDYYKMAYGSKIQFLHRTVKDFFEDPKRYEEIKRLASADGFNEHLALLRAWILRAKLLPSQSMYGTMDTFGAVHLPHLVVQAGRFAEKVSMATKTKPLVKELNRTYEVLIVHSHLGLFMAEKSGADGGLGNEVGHNGESEAIPDPNTLPGNLESPAAPTTKDEDGKGSAESGKQENLDASGQSVPPATKENKQGRISKGKVLRKLLCFSKPTRK